LVREKADYWRKTQAELKAKEKREAELVAVVRQKRAQGCRKWMVEEASVLD